MKIPFFRASIGEGEIAEVVATLRSGWLTTGSKTKEFEAKFAQYVGSKHAVALNSATAALHLGLEAIGLRRDDVVLVPTMTFAATAEVVRYFDAKPLLVDCNEDDCNINIADLQRQIELAMGRGERLRAIIPVHYAGQAADMKAIRAIAQENGLKIIEDAAHCCPAYYLDGDLGWKHVGSDADVACYSFYANKCITTGEGGMACTNSDEIADRMRIMSLHGISKDAWKRFTGEGTWYYEIIAPGFKYNLTDIASAIGVKQLERATILRSKRANIAARYRESLADVAELRLPVEAPARKHSWHLFAIRIDLEQMRIDRAAVISLLKQVGVSASVHWIALHLHPYYREKYGFRPSDFPIAEKMSRELISLPLFPDMTQAEVDYVCEMLKKILYQNRR